MAGWLISFWAAPVMSAGHLVFAVSQTIYILIALFFEERNLIEAFGESYRFYREKTPMLIPAFFKERKRRVGYVGD